jgi:hypothetical protein
VRELARDLVALAIDVAGVLDRHLDLPGDRLVVDRGPGARQRHQRRVVDARSPQQLVERVRLLERRAEHALDLVLRDDVRIDVRRAEPLALARDLVALSRVRVPARVVDDAEATAVLGEPQVGVVLAQLQPVLGARREHPVRLGDAARDQVVDQDAEVSLVAPRAPPVLAARMTRRVHAREQPLRGRFLVAGRAVDLSGEEQSADRLGLERRVQRARIEVVVLDRVAGTQDVRVLATGQRAHERDLHVERQRRRHAVRIDLVRREPLGLEEHLVRVAMREAHDLVLDRRAVARPDAFDDARVQRRAVERAADEIVRRRARVRDPARQLRGMHVARSHEREHRRGIVARLHLEARENRSCGRRAAAACRS